MPLCFKETYPTTRCIIDCTELFVQVPSSLAGQIVLYSSYEHCVTYKGPIGIAPSGAITSVSRLLSGTLLDKEITCRSRFFKSRFLTTRWFSRGRPRLYNWEKSEGPSCDIKYISISWWQRSAWNRWSNTTLKYLLSANTCGTIYYKSEKFKLLKSAIPLTIHGSINQVWTIACLLCNFMDPLIRQSNHFQKLLKVNNRSTSLTKLVYWYT